MTFSVLVHIHLTDLHAWAMGEAREKHKGQLFYCSLEVDCEFANPIGQCWTTSPLLLGPLQTHAHTGLVQRQRVRHNNSSSCQVCALPWGPTGWNGCKEVQRSLWEHQGCSKSTFQDSVCSSDSTTSCHCLQCVCFLTSLLHWTCMMSCLLQRASARCTAPLQRGFQQRNTDQSSKQQGICCNHRSSHRSSSYTMSSCHCMTQKPCWLSNTIAVRPGRDPLRLSEMVFRQRRWTMTRLSVFWMPAYNIVTIGMYRLLFKARELSSTHTCMLLCEHECVFASLLAGFVPCKQETRSQCAFKAAAEHPARGWRQSCSQDKSASPFQVV